MADQTNNEQFLTTPQVAAALGYSDRGLRKLSLDGILEPAGTLGRNRIWRADGIEDLRERLAKAGRSGRRQTTERLAT